MGIDVVTLALAKGYTDGKIRDADFGEVPLDTSLTKKGQAADAKAVGDAISKLSGGNVAYDEAQELTDEQKARARENIGAQPAGDYLTEVPKGYAKTEDIPTDEHIIDLIEENAPESSGGGISITGATVGQTVKISAVDENGVPTAWEPAAFPEGGGGGGNKEWVCLLNTTTTEDVLTLNITKDIEGNAFSVDEVYIRLHLINPNGGGTILINLGTSASTQLVAQGLFASRTQAYVIINIYKKANGWIADHSISHESVQGSIGRPYLSVSTEIVPSITSLFISTTSEKSFFAVGSTIEIWGAKA